MVKGDLHCQQQLIDFASKIDVLTFEFENVNINALQSLPLPIYPALKALEIAQDRQLEKQCLIDNNVPVANYIIVNNISELKNVSDKINWPCIAKTCRDGYDGKGQMVVRDQQQLETFFCAMQQRIIVEDKIAFDRELSIIAVRSQQGNILYYPLIENQHEQGMLHLSRIAKVNEALQTQAQNYAKTILESLAYVGVLVIEFFQQGEKLLANEMAPRVHNSGHWTVEGARTSQFENHLRAVCGLPLQPTDLVKPTAMLNIIGQIPDMQSLCNVSELHWHDYGKVARPKRKLGHITLCAQDEQQLSAKINTVNKVVFPI